MDTVVIADILEWFRFLGNDVNPPSTNISNTMPVTGASIAGAAKAMSNNNSSTHINSNNNPKSSNNNNNQTSLNFQGAYIVEKIVGHFTNANGVIYYHVKWSGYPLSNKDVGCMSRSNIVSGFDDML